MRNDLPEKIVCSAVHYDDGQKHDHQPKNIETGYVTFGLRHHNCITTHAIIQRAKGFGPGEGPRIEKEQGFLTNKDRFVDRKEAALIAIQQGQILKIVKELDSSDLF